MKSEYSLYEPLDFGKHCGSTLTELLRTHPGYVFYALFVFDKPIKIREWDDDDYEQFKDHILGDLYPHWCQKR